MERKRVSFYYKGLYEDGTMFVEKRSGDPEVIVTGRGDAPAKLEKALANMEPGDTGVIEIGKGYGEYDEGAIKTRILRASIPNGESLAEGMEIMWRTPQNPFYPMPARVIRADEFSFDLDFNHPLAGKNLVYEVEVVNITDYNEAAAC